MDGKCWMVMFVYLDVYGNMESMIVRKNFVKISS